jgi:hypothetical protein
MEFNGTLVLQQLQYSGVFEAVQIRKSGCVIARGAGLLLCFSCRVRGRQGLIKFLLSLVC